MFFDDHKKAITTIMAKRSPKGENLSGPTPMKPESSKEEDGSFDGKHAAAEDMIAAMHEKSAHKMKEAMSNFIDIHHAKQSMEAGDEEPAESE